MGFERLGKIGKLLGITIAGVGVTKDIPPAAAKEVAAFTQEAAERLRKSPTPSETELDRRLRDSQENRKTVETFRENILRFREELEQVRDERDRNTMRWYALTEQIPLTNKSIVHWAKGILSQLTLTVKELEPVYEQLEDGRGKVSDKKILNHIVRTNNQFRTFFEISPDIRDTVYAEEVRFEEH